VASDDRREGIVASKPLVYVHGAGPQSSAQAFKDEADRLIFGRRMTSTRVAHYAGVRWPPPTGGGPAAAPQRSSRRRRVAAIRASMQPGVPATTAAADVVAATLADPGPAGAGAAAAAPPSASDIAEATRFVARLYREADRVAERSPMPRPDGAAFGVSFPDPIFRFVVGKFASDVIDYLYGPYAAAMRAPVRAALLKTPKPKVIVAHSLGTIITYDVLSEPALAGLDVDLLVTLGCPLGIANVQDRLRDRAGRPNPVPASLTAWGNYADRFDPVALDATLRDEFDPPRNFARDEEVNNQARNNHDLAGYLSIGIVRSAIAAAVG
jgi:hypothetical protein